MAESENGARLNAVVDSVWTKLVSRAAMVLLFPVMGWVASSALQKLDSVAQAQQLAATLAAHLDDRVGSVEIAVRSLSTTAYSASDAAGDRRTQALKDMEEERRIDDHETRLRMLEQQH